MDADFRNSNIIDLKNNRQHQHHQIESAQNGWQIHVAFTTALCSISSQNAS